MLQIRCCKNAPYLRFAGLGAARHQGHAVGTRLAIAQAELRALKYMVADLRRDRDAWRAQAERLAAKLMP